MKTITFDEDIKISKGHFKNLDDFQAFIEEELKTYDLTDSHKEILDKLIKEAKENPENNISLEELSSSINRKRL